MSRRQIARIAVASLCAVVCGFLAPQSISPQSCCVLPTTEDSLDSGTNWATLEEQFNQTLSDTAGDVFDAHTVQELTTQPGQDTCYWSGSGLPQYPGVAGGSWTVGSVAGSPQSNHWGYDSIGWNSTTINLIRSDGPAHGITLPCGFKIYQSMEYECDANTFFVYNQDVLTETVDIPANGLKVCRDATSSNGDCGDISY